MKKLDENIALVKRKPRRWLPLVLLAVAPLLLVMWLSGFLREKGKQAAERTTSGRSNDTTAMRPTQPSDVSSTVLDDARKKGAESPHAANATEEEDTLTGHPGIAERNADEATSHKQANQHPGRQYVREDTAAGIFASLAGIEQGFGGDREFTARVEELYVGRWVTEAGWKGTVKDLPERFMKDMWLVKVVEDGNAAEPVLIMAFTTNTEAAGFRVGDTVVVTGRITDVDRVILRKRLLDPATVLPR